MPIVRTYQCEQCFNRIELTLPMEQWDRPPPDCPVCAQQQMQQDFKPVAIGGSASARAHAIAEDIAGNDYHVADMQREHRPEGTPTVRYKSPSAAPAQASGWGATGEALSLAIANGRETRLQYGSGLDVLQANIKSGREPDLIELSKRRSIRVG
jgi:hypothetical protein